MNTAITILLAYIALLLTYHIIGTKAAWGALQEHAEEQAEREEEALQIARDNRRDMNYLMKPHREQQRKEEQQFVEGLRIAVWKLFNRSRR